MNVKVRRTTVINLLHVSMNAGPIHASARLGTLEMDIAVLSQNQDPAVKSGNTSAVAETM